MATIKATNAQDGRADVDAYIAALPKESRATLEQLRKDVKAVAPEATELMSYQIPTFKLKRPLVAYAAFNNHCSLFVMSKAIMERYKKELSDYDTGKTKTTLRSPAGKPLPAMLVKKIVKARIAEIQAG